MKTLHYLILSIMIITLTNCSTNQPEQSDKDQASNSYIIDKFADIKVMRYDIPDFENLSLQQKKLSYYLSKAALCGRDIFFDQNYKNNLKIKKTLEAIIQGFTGNTKTADYENFVVYVKRFWFSNGIHHHYSTDKFFPQISQEYFKSLIKGTASEDFPLSENQTMDEFISEMTLIIFDPTVAPKRISLDPATDLIQASANNYYEGVTQAEVEDFYQKMIDPKDKTPISYGLNSKLVKENGKVVEKVYKLDGMYGKAIESIIYWLQKATTVAENEQQKQSLEKLIEYYKTGNLKIWDEYNIIWAQDTISLVDATNGFIENYGDAMGYKASWESVVNFKNLEATKRTEIISKNALWFEENSPIDQRFKKTEVKGVSAKVITVVQLGGDCYPSTPIGINLPNSNWIRQEYGSKSVTMENITYAYDQAAIGDGFIEEFANSPEEVELAKKYGSLAGNIHTDLHECLGHGSGQLLPGVSTDVLKNYYSTLEESRADLFALYYMMDQKMVDLGIIPSLDVAVTEYNSYIRNGLMTQLTRIELGKDIEQAHMRNRQLIASWCYEKGQTDSIIRKEIRDNETYFFITDYNKLRNLFGTLLAEVQRIKSEGDYEAAKNLVESYAIKINPELHKEVLERYAKLNLAPYGGFVNPILKPAYKDDEIIDVTIEYPASYMQQMLDYAKEYSYLPVIN